MPEREFILRQLRTLRDTMIVTRRSSQLADEADLLIVAILDKGWAYTDLKPAIEDFSLRVRQSLNGSRTVPHPSTSL